MFMSVKEIDRAIAFAWVLFAAAWPNLGAGSAFAGEIQIKCDGAHRMDPLAITKVTLGNSPVQCGLVVSPTQLQPVIPIQAGDDWLQNLTLYVLNRTNKTIVFSHIRLSFPETGDGKSTPQVVYYITLGRIPASVAFTRAGTPIRQAPSQQAIQFASGQTLPVQVGNYFDMIKASVERVMPFTSVTKCNIRMDLSYFDDGTKFSGVSYWAPDPQHPGNFTELDRKTYFPGIPSWPPGYSTWPPKAGN